MYILGMGMEIYFEFISKMTIWVLNVYSPTVLYINIASGIIFYIHENWCAIYQLGQ